jgi:hypothetical protein
MSSAHRLLSACLRRDQMWCLTSTWGYLCSWTGSRWKCGCLDQACTQSYWQFKTLNASGQTCPPYPDQSGEGGYSSLSGRGREGVKAGSRERPPRLRRSFSGAYGLLTPFLPASTPSASLPCRGLFAARACLCASGCLLCFGLRLSTCGRGRSGLLNHLFLSWCFPFLW